MKHFECQKVLNEVLANFAEENLLKIAYPNIAFEPEVDKMWLKLFYMPTTSDNRTFGKNREQIRGIMQVDIFSPRETGTKNAYDIADKLQDVFGVNTSVKTSNGFVRITEFNIDSFQEENWFRIMVEIHYTSFN